MRKNWLLLGICLLLSLSCLTSCKEEITSVDPGKNSDEVTFDGITIKRTDDINDYSTILFNKFNCASVETNALEQYVSQYSEAQYEDENEALVKTKKRSSNHEILSQNKSLKGGIYYYKNYSGNERYTSMNASFGESSAVKYKEEISTFESYSNHTATGDVSIYNVDLSYNDETQIVKEQGYTKDYDGRALKAPASLVFDRYYGVGKGLDINQIEKAKASFRLTESYIIVKYRYEFNLLKYMASEASITQSNKDGEYTYETYYFNFKTMLCEEIIREQYIINRDEDWKIYDIGYCKTITKVCSATSIDSNIDDLLLHLEDETFESLIQLKDEE